jgi:putative DNA primase/helicase
MDLLGVRWAIVQETEKDKRLAVATMKRLTGGDTITARRMRQDFVSFEPSHTALLFTNHLPRVPGDDPALWRRIRVVPFDVVIPEPEQDKHLAERLQLEAAGILRWAVAGYGDWSTRGGLDAPEAVTVATDRYHADSDALTQFIAECCLLNPHMFATTGELFARWSKWATVDGADPVSRKAFGLALDRVGYPTDPRSNRRVRRGIGLLSEDEE